MTAITSDDGSRVYVIPTPDGPVELPSVTTITSALPQPALDNWKRTNAVHIICHDPGLSALVASASKPSDAAVRDAIKQALDRNRTAANTGTALHAMTERIDADEVLSGLTPELEAVTRGYERLRAQHGFHVVASEQIVFSHEHGFAGRFDRVLDFPGLGRLVVDIKTGRSVYADVALQLAAYANAEGIFVEDGHRFEPMPDGLRTDLGAVMHLPADGSDPVVKLVQLDEAWPVFCSLTVSKRWLTEQSKRAILGVHQPVVDPEAQTRVTAQRREFVRAVIGEMRALDADALDALVRAWPSDLPTLKQAETHTPEQVQRMVDLVHEIAGRFSLPFFEASDPVHVPEPLADFDAGVDLASSLDQLPDDLRAEVVADLPAAGLLRRTRCTRAMFERIVARIDAAFVEAARRSALLDEALPDDLGDEAAVLTLVGCSDLRQVTATQFDAAVAVMAALRGDFLLMRDDGDRVSIVVAADACERLEEIYGGKRDALAFARDAARSMRVASPRSLAACAANALLVARMAMGAPHTRKVVA